MSRDVQEPTPHVAPSKAEGSKSKYKRILLKLSGEALMGEHDFGIDLKCLTGWRWRSASSSVLGYR